MEQLRLATYKQARNLKELGYPQDLFYGLWYYATNDSIDPIPFCSVALTKDYIVCPSLELVAKWLREEHDIDISIDVGTKEERYKYGRTYTPHILFCGVDGTLNILLDFNVVCDSYEKVLSMSIDRAIKMLSGNESTNN